MDYFIYNLCVNDKLDDKILNSIIMDKGDLEEKIKEEKNDNQIYRLKIDEPKKHISDKSIRRKTERDKKLDY